MAFREKSAWAMATVMTIAALYYLNMVVSASRETQSTAPPLAIMIGYVILVVVGSVVAQTTLALASPKEASAPADERERTIIQSAGNMSGNVLGVGVVTSLLLFLHYGNGFLLFHMIMGSLIVAQIAEYGLQIMFLRQSA